MAAELERQIGMLKHGDHVCLIYETPEEQFAASIPFMRDGLRNGECCLYLTDERTSEDVLDALGRESIEVRAELERGALVVATGRSTYLRGDRFEPHRMIDFLDETSRAARAAGFRGLRVTGEMTWALGPEQGCDRIVEYEALLNEYFPGTSSLAICQYNRCRFPPEVIHDVLRTHPIAVLGEQVCPNLYYEPPALVLGGESMEHRVAWMIEQLKRARDAQQVLEHADRTKSQFLAMMSHELRTPLNAITGYLYLLDAEVSGPVNEEQRRHLARIRASAGHLLEIIEEILTFAGLESGEAVVRMNPVDLALLVGDTVDRARPLGEPKGLMLIAHDTGGPVPVVTDETKVRQILLSLLSNAVKFTDYGRVDVTVESTGGTVTIRVADTGIGIPEDAWERIFEPFTQLDAGTTRRAGGTGLGLAVGRRLARLLGGDLYLERTDRSGSTFRLDLPRSPAGGNGPSRAGPARVGSG